MATSLNGKQKIFAVELERALPPSLLDQLIQVDDNSVEMLETVASGQHRNYFGDSNVLCVC